MNRLLWKFQCGDFNVNIKKEGYGCKNLLSSTVDGCMPNETLEKCFSDKTLCEHQISKLWGFHALGRDTINVKSNVTSGHPITYLRPRRALTANETW